MPSKPRRKPSAPALPPCGTCRFAVPEERIRTDNGEKFTALWCHGAPPVAAFQAHWIEAEKRTLYQAVASAYPPVAAEQIGCAQHKERG